MSRRVVTRLLEHAGRTSAADAGIRLRDTPAPLYRLLVLSTLLSTPINAGLAVAATRELVAAGMGTVRRMADSAWQDRVDALGRAHYRRYDESTATALGQGARQILDEYRGDLRRLRHRADGDPDRVRALLREFPRLGPVGADIFCREAQGIWPELRPALDGKVLDGARAVGLPADAGRIAALAGDEELVALAAALVRVGLDDALAAEVRR